MATNTRIKRALLEKLGVSQQRLSQLAQARKKELPMTTEQAVYTIAHEHGIDIARDLSREETAEVRQLVASLRTGWSTAQGSAPNGRARRMGARPKPVSVSITRFPEVKIPGISPAHAKEAKVMAERVYPRLYLFENSLRDLIERVLRAADGDGWWSKVPKKVRDTASRHEADEKRDPWHGKRGARPIDYVFLEQLWDIIKHRWKTFKDLFPGQAWIEALVTNDMNVSRRVIAHMNPLGEDDVKNIETAFNKWTKQLEAIEALLP